MNDYIIKEAVTEAEIDGKAYVHYRSWQETYTGLIDSDYLNIMTLEKCTEIARKFPDNILVAKDDDRIVGFTAYGPHRDDTLTGYGEIYAIYVLQEYHGKKLGYRLMNVAIDKLSQYTGVALWVLKSNEKAIQFYGKYGFTFDGTEKTILLGAPNTEIRMVYLKA